MTLLNFVLSITASALSSCVVGCILAFVVNKQAKKQEEQEQERTALVVSMLETTNASLSLGTALASELLETGKCNGKTTEALKYAATVRHRQEDQLRHNAASKF